MSALTITEFLLARVAEDEEAVHEARGRDSLYRESKTFYSHLGESRDDWGVYCFNVPLDRMERECEAKRRIIDLGDGMTRYTYSGDDAAAWDEQRDLVLRLLAQPYADHSDFDPSWKVQ